MSVQWWGGQFASGRLPADSDLAERMSAAHAAVAGAVRRAAGARRTAPTCGCWPARGIPTLHYGPGDAVLAHAPDERVPLAEVHTAARALALLALDVCGTA